MMVQKDFLDMSELSLEGFQTEQYLGSFKELVLGAIDESLSSLGETAKQRIYFHLKEQHNISMEEIPSKIWDFAEALEESYGQVAQLIEIRIMTTLYQKAKPFLYFPHGKDLSFPSYVETLRYFL